MEQSYQFNHIDRSIRVSTRRCFSKLFPASLTLALCLSAFLPAGEISCQEVPTRRHPDEAMNLMKLRSLYTFIALFRKAKGTNPIKFRDLEEHQSIIDKEVLYLSKFYENPQTGQIEAWHLDVLNFVGGEVIVAHSSMFELSGVPLMYVLFDDGRTARIKTSELQK
ncbi:MAG: hypothetical protein CJBNEKGG_04492 [Prosthecobacter sp.]|nr:hypothetical protein [Prosthecobacter sp.]